MPNYVALLRGINVGGNNKVPMSVLKELFEKNGFDNVLTYINSGNVMFGSVENNLTLLTDKIERLLKVHFEFDIKTTIRSGENIRNLIRKLPQTWQNNTEQKTDILFLWEKYNNAKSLQLIKTNPAVDNLIYIDGAIVWNILRKNYSKSSMHKFIGSELYKNMTARNINTVRKLATLI